MAIFVGMLDGMNLGDNSKAFLMTKGNHEIMTLGRKLGAKTQTALSLAEIGDVIVTCSSKHSRNRHVREQLGRGKKLDQILEAMNMVAENVNATKNAQKLFDKFELESPILSGMYQILHENKDPQKVLESL